MKFEEALKTYVTEARMCKKAKRRAAMKRRLQECGCEDQGSEQVSMIVNDMSRVAEQSAEIANYVQHAGPMEEWVHEKIAAVSREIDNLYHYVQGLQNQPRAEQQPMVPGMSQLSVPMIGSKGPAMVMGDKPGRAPVGTYVFSTEKKHHKMKKAKKAGRVCSL